MTFEIFMPFYGRFDHFREAVQSVLDQADPDLRLIVVDDVYPDLAPGQWLQSLGDPRVTYIRNDVNLRPSANYRKCVSLMSSEFSVLMGSDDIMLPNYISTVKSLISAHPEADVFQVGVKVIDSDGAPTQPLADRVKRIYQPATNGPLEMSGQALARSLLRGNWTYFPSLVWRVSELQKHQFRLDLDVVQDLAMLLDITFDGGSLVLDNRHCFNYRRHSNSLSAVTGFDGSKFGQELQLFSEAADRCDERNWTRAAQAARLHLSSRLNALTEVPAALLKRNFTAVRTLGRHVFSNRRG